LKKNENGKLVMGIKKLLSTPLGLIPGVVVFILEGVILNPFPYELYAMTWHGFVLGMLAFFFGFCFVLGGSEFWNMIVKYKWMFVSVAIALFVVRLLYWKMNTPMYLLVTESQCSIISVFAFAHQYLNRGGRTLAYLSQAAYPIYILHMLFLYLGSMLIFPMAIDVRIQFVLVLLFTIVGCFATYEVVRRLKWIRVLFGLKNG
jgi:glucan biosynthesis protein C